MKAIQGLHHITAIASDPQRNVDFYHEVLGQRLVKTTVNFDDPGTYHLYYGDEIGSPGTIMTFFPWKGIRKGQPGSGETGAVAYSIPSHAVDYWRERLNSFDITVSEGQRLGDPVLSFPDPDGMTLELIANDEHGTIQFWNDGPFAQEYAIRGFHGVTLWVAQAKATARLLVDQLGYSKVAGEGHRTRYAGASADLGLYVDLLERPDLRRGVMGAGSVHHIAFRTVDDTEQLEYRRQLINAGYGVSAVKDRQYFHSIYFREPNGVLFEIATGAPGFRYDEPLAELGKNLKLPAWYEELRPQLEDTLPKLNIPSFAKEAANNDD